MLATRTLLKITLSLEALECALKDSAASEPDRQAAIEAVRLGRGEAEIRVQETIWVERELRLP